MYHNLMKTWDFIKPILKMLMDTDTEENFGIGSERFLSRTTFKHYCEVWICLTSSLIQGTQYSRTAQHLWEQFWVVFTQLSLQKQLLTIPRHATNHNPMSLQNITDNKKGRTDFNRTVLFDQPATGHTCQLSFIFGHCVPPPPPRHSVHT